MYRANFNTGSPESAGSYAGIKTFKEPLITHSPMKQSFYKLGSQRGKMVDRFKNAKLFLRQSLVGQQPDKLEAEYAAPVKVEEEPSEYNNYLQGRTNAKFEN